MVKLSKSTRIRTLNLRSRLIALVSNQIVSDIKEPTHLLIKSREHCPWCSAYDTKFFINLFERAFKMMKNGVYFIVIALLVAELFKNLVYD